MYKELLAGLEKAAEQLSPDDFEALALKALDEMQKQAMPASGTSSVDYKGMLEEFEALAQELSPEELEVVAMQLLENMDKVAGVPTEDQIAEWSSQPAPPGPAAIAGGIVGGGIGTGMGALAGKVADGFFDYGGGAKLNAGRGALIGTAMGAGIAGLSSDFNMVRDEYENKEASEYTYSDMLEGFERLAQELDPEELEDLSREMLAYMQEGLDKEALFERIPKFFSVMRSVPKAMGEARAAARDVGLARKALPIADNAENIAKYRPDVNIQPAIDRANAYRAQGSPGRVSSAINAFRNTTSEAGNAFDARFRQQQEARIAQRQAQTAQRLEARQQSDVRRMVNQGRASGLVESKPIDEMASNAPLKVPSELRQQPHIPQTQLADPNTHVGDNGQMSFNFGQQHAPKAEAQSQHTTPNNAGQMEFNFGQHGESLVPKQEPAPVDNVGNIRNKNIRPVTPRTQRQEALPPGEEPKAQAAGGNTETHTETNNATTGTQNNANTGTQNNTNTAAQAGTTQATPAASNPSDFHVTNWAKQNWKPLAVGAGGVMVADHFLRDRNN